MRNGNQKKSNGNLFSVSSGFTLYFIRCFSARAAVLKRKYAHVTVTFTKHNHFCLLFVFGLWQYQHVSCYIRD